MAARDLDHEILALRRRIAALLKQAHTNEQRLKRTQQREMELLKADTLPQLFDVICLHLLQSYRLDHVTLTVVDRDHEIQHLLLGEQVQLEQHPQVLFVDDAQDLQALFAPEHQPWLGAYAPHRHRRLFKNPGNFQSIALIPLWQRGHWLGCIAFGSSDPTRFTPDLATDFLAHMGVVAAFAMDNAINRARLVRSGITDFLTGWHNRRYLHERLKEELSHAVRNRTAVACVLLDLDHFKTINDTYGHQIGDRALKAAAGRINQQIRGSDAAARYGGDEFVVIVRELNQEQVSHLAERMRQAVCATPLALSEDQEHRMTVSVGVALMQIDEASIDMKSAAEELLAQADVALYRAKQGGRNRVEVMLC